MTQTQIIEIVKMHHPEMGDTEIRIYLNKALDEFCEHTRILQGQQTFTTTASTRYYKLDDLDLKIQYLDTPQFFQKSNHQNLCIWFLQFQNFSRRVLA